MISKGSSINSAVSLPHLLAVIAGAGYWFSAASGLEPGDSHERQ